MQVVPRGRKDAAEEETQTKPTPLDKNLPPQEFPNTLQQGFKLQPHQQPAGRALSGWGAVGGMFGGEKELRFALEQ